MQSSIEQLSRSISGILSRYPAVEAAYLFGSHAKGAATAQSDIDLALVGKAPRLVADKLDMLADFATVGIDAIDLVILDGADTVLRFEAVSPNRLLYARPGFDHGSFFSRVLREYFDFEPYLRVQRQALKARILDGQD